MGIDTFRPCLWPTYSPVFWAQCLALVLGLSCTKFVHFWVRGRRTRGCHWVWMVCDKRSLVPPGCIMTRWTEGSSLSRTAFLHPTWPKTSTHTLFGNLPVFVIYPCTKECCLLTRQTNKQTTKGTFIICPVTYEGRPKNNRNLNVARELEVIARCAARCRESTQYSSSLPRGVNLGWLLLLLWIFFLSAC